MYVYPANIQLKKRNPNRLIKFYSQSHVLGLWVLKAQFFAQNNVRRIVLVPIIGKNCFLARGGRR